MFSYRLDAVQFSNFRFAIFLPSKGCLEQIALSDMAARCIGFLVNNYCCIVSKIESTLIQEYKKKMSIASPVPTAGNQALLSTRVVKNCRKKNKTLPLFSQISENYTYIGTFNIVDLLYTDNFIIHINY